MTARSGLLAELRDGSGMQDADGRIANRRGGDVTEPTGGGAILPAPACDLLDRLTQTLEIGFTLTDLHGAVVASTGQRRAGQVEPAALAVLDEDRREAGRRDDGEICIPVRLSGRIAGALIVHDGADERVRAIARVSAVSIGLALDFAAAAASLGRETIDPGFLLYRLLRGHRQDALHARIIAAIFGWNLFEPRVAIVILASGREQAERRNRPNPTELIQRLLGDGWRSTPFGQIDEEEWVVLPVNGGEAAEQELRAFARRLHAELAEKMWRVDMGIGESHQAANPVVCLRRSYRDALSAARLGSGVHDEPGIYDLRSIGPAAFFAPSGPSRRNLATLVLRPLESQPAIRDTLRTFLDADMSVAETATRLSLHRHTVRTHLDRVGQLTGLNPRTIDGAVQLKLALLVAGGGGRAGTA